MWRHICKPDVLIYLDASLGAISRRRQIDWGQPYLAVLQNRLRDARANCDLYIHTDDRSPDSILQQALRFLATLDPSTEGTDKSRA
jgi:hypothetical protein